MDAVKGLLLFVIMIPALGLIAVGFAAVLFGPPYLAVTWLERIHPMHGIVWGAAILAWITLLYALLVEPGKLWERFASWRESR